jgi:hypothetical protein
VRQCSRFHTAKPSALKTGGFAFVPDQYRFGQPGLPNREVKLKVVTIVPRFQ